MAQKALIFLSVLTLLLCAGCRKASAQGFVLSPGTNKTLPLELKSHSVAVQIMNLSAEFDVLQSVKTRNGTPLEGVFYFALPKNAVISNLVITIDGASANTDVMKNEEMLGFAEMSLKNGGDPAMLELLDYNIFDCRIPAITSRNERMFRIRYTQYLQEHAGTIRLEYPVLSDIWRAIDANAATVEQEIVVTVKSSKWLTNFYSPSNALKLGYSTPQDARIHAFLQEHTGNRFILFHNQTNDVVGTSILTHKLATDEFGYFLLSYAIPVDIPASRMLKKNILFVLDISKSMEGAKLKHAKVALKNVIRQLDDEDYYNVIAFNSESRLFRQKLVRAGDNKEEGIKFVNRLHAKGGTNIHEALLSALAHKTGADGPKYIIFITDGKPTVGLTDGDAIRQAVKSLNKSLYRIYTVGIGYDIDTSLLDGISSENFARTIYIEPDEKIETAFLNAYHKIAKPYLSALQLKFSNIDIFDVYPETLPEITSGGQLFILGRYRGSAEEAVIDMTGNSRKGPTAFESEVAFPAIEEQNDFLAALWASRKMARNLQSIRRHGVTDKERDEITMLTAAYGLLTPCSGQLVSDWQDLHGNEILDVPVQTIQNQKTEISAEDFMAAKSGKHAVQSSVMVNDMKDAVILSPQPAQEVKTVKRRNFERTQSGSWVDWGFRDEYETLHIKYASKAYFQLLQSYPGIAPYMALGDKVIFKCENEFVQIDDAGVDELTEEMLRNMFSRLLYSAPVSGQVD